MINIQVEYRAKTEAPTQNGWYFGKWKHPPSAYIVPRLVVDGMVYPPGHEVPHLVKDFDWFGPVTEVKEG